MIVNRSKAALPLVCLAVTFSLPLMLRADDDAARELLVQTIAECESPKVQAAFLRGMLKGLEGQRRAQAPKGWQAVSQKLSDSSDPGVRELVLQLSQIYGDQAATAAALEVLRDEAAAADRRRTALFSLLNQQNQEASLMLEALLEDEAMRVDAIRGYAIVENQAAPSILLGRMDTFNPQQQRAVVETLASRKSYAQAMLKSLQSGDTDKSSLPAHVVRSLRELLGDAFTSVYGPIKELGQERQQQFAKYTNLLTEERLAKADASRGRAVFAKTCAACHQLYGVGGGVGPDLTGSNRANLDYLLLNSIDPSFDVPEAYQTTQVMTVDGRVVNGVLAEEDNNRIVLKTPEQARVAIAKSDIEVRKVSPKSMMPEGQLEQLAPQEVVDLVRYLQTTEQVELAK